jgi:acetyl esterase/lipase
MAAVALLLPLVRRGAAQDPPGVRVLRDVEYGRGGGRALKLHLILPETPPVAPLPVIVGVHGGGWRTGNRDSSVGPLAAMARRGYAGASIEYRLSGEAVWPAQIEDCKCAIRFLRAHAKQYGLDPLRIGAWGASAGGHLAALLGTSGGTKELEGTGGYPDQSSRVQAVCDWFGPTDLVQLDAGDRRSREQKSQSPLTLLFGGLVEEKRKEAEQANPIRYITRDDPPFLIVHGDKDPLVPLSQSQLLYDALKKAGVPASLEVVQGGGHGGPQFSAPELVTKINAFFDRYLKSP